MKLVARFDPLKWSIDVVRRGSWVRAIGGRTRVAVACALFSATTACSAASPAAGLATPRSAAPADVPIAAVHTSKCGACHTRPAPGTRARAHLEEAFARHRKRVHMTDEEWRAMVDYLALAPAQDSTAAHDSAQRGKQVSARE